MPAPKGPRDTTKARLHIRAATTRLLEAVDALEKAVDILGDVDDRTGKRDPSKRAKKAAKKVRR